jgi:hypothetical protein
VLGGTPAQQDKFAAGPINSPTGQKEAIMADSTIDEFAILQGAIEELGEYRSNEFGADSPLADMGPNHAALNILAEQRVEARELLEQAALYTPANSELAAAVVDYFARSPVMEKP